MGVCEVWDKFSKGEKKYASNEDRQRDGRTDGLITKGCLLSGVLIIHVAEMTSWFWTFLFNFVFQLKDEIYFENYFDYNI